MSDIKQKAEIFYFPVAIPRSKFNPLYWLVGKHKITFGCKAIDLITSKIDLDTSRIRFVEREH